LFCSFFNFDAYIEEVLIEQNI